MRGGYFHYTLLPSGRLVPAGRTISYLSTNQEESDCLASDASELKAGNFNSEVKRQQLFFRESFWQSNLTHGWAFDWQFAFNKDEIQLFLKINVFGVLECIDRPSYAFNTYVIVAQ